MLPSFDMQWYCKKKKKYIFNLNTSKHIFMGKVCYHFVFCLYVQLCVCVYILLYKDKCIKRIKNHHHIRAYFIDNHT